MKCALIRILPFALTLFIGLSLGSFSWRPGSLQVRGGRREKLNDTPYSRTWLVIHYQPTPSFAQESAETGREPCTGASLRVRFEANGKVSEAIPEEMSVQDDDCVAAAVRAARQIVFTPASENGKPVSVWATVSYGYGQMHFTGVDKKGRRFCVTSRSQVVSPVEIVSVEGAKETEGWRVVYE